MSIINLEQRIATCFSCFLPSNSREQRSNIGILGIAAHSMLVSLPPCGLFVAFAGTKHCCLTAINRCGALCCPDFPRDRGLKPWAFLPLSRDRPTHYLYFADKRRSCDKRIYPFYQLGSPKNFNFWGERRHKSPNVASDILCDLVAERESPPSPCKKDCVILLHFQGPLTRWGEILVFLSFHSRVIACFVCQNIPLQSEYSFPIVV